MYITTFYSFKGGVGRTLAMVNVGVELVRAGKKVLLVDFDLEAPGIDTFSLLKPQTPHPGVVEFVSTYASTLESPDVKGFCYRVDGISQDRGELWVMPAGTGDQLYAEKLAAIDWQKLYREDEGYLMIEDLRAQWRDVISPDYVLIDSRTGHTDVAGICTRQLPDSVAILFFPNEQNLAGLRSIVSDIRSEANSVRGHPVNLHFAMSNVPDLDDEDQILEQRVAEFRDALGYEELAATIHRYDSLSLLNQVIFTMARPKSRLAREYVALKNDIVSQNLDDRDAAVRHLEEVLTRPTWLRFADRGTSEEQLKKILKTHAHDVKIMFLLAMVHKRLGRPAESLRLLEKPLDDSGYRKSQILLERAEVRLLCDDQSRAALDIFDALNSNDLHAEGIERCIRLLQKADRSSIARLPATPAIQALTSEERIEVADELQGNRAELEVAVAILSPVLDDKLLSADELNNAVNQIVMCHIGLGRFSAAKEVAARWKPDTESFDIQILFNYAMAAWAETDKVPADVFKRVISLDADEATLDPTLKSANYNQCLAIAFWGIGNTAVAIDRLQEAKQIMLDGPDTEFSCWRYLKVSPTEFHEDCNSILALLSGETIRPRFFDVPLFPG